jgi:hypothetical protein
MKKNVMEQNYISVGNFHNEENKITFEAMIKLISIIEDGTNKRQDNPKKIFDFVLQNKNLCKKYRNIGIETNDLFEIKKYQMLIDEIVDPLIETCYAIQIENGIMSTTSAELNALVSGEVKPTDIELAVSKHFQQIICSATKEQIEYYFMILAKEINPATMKPYMTVEDVREFISLNFAACGTAGNKKYFEIGTEVKSTITYFIYQFYMKYDNGNIANKLKYVNLLISNFKMFANDNPQSLLSNMTPSKYPKNKNNVIDIEKYFPKNK